VAGLIDPEIDALLKDTSRSFYLTLEMLPKKIRRQVGLLYLLARVADTIADTKTGSAQHLIEALERYDSVAQGISSELPDLQEIAELQENNGERKLLLNVAEVVSSLSIFGEDDKKLIRNCLGIIIGGQTLDLQRFGPANDSGAISALEKREELDDYAYRVAGSVGEFWTHMTCNHIIQVREKNRDVLFELGIRFGKALQMINILRDIPEDLRFGRCYIPIDSLEEIGLDKADLLDPNNMEKFRPLYNENLDITVSHLDAAVEYIGMLPYSQFRLRAACMLPVLIGQRTVGMLRNQNVLDSEKRVKVSRDEIKDLVKKTKRALLIPGAGQKLLRSNQNV
jgi:farnesyl-diphosphate farnesyltransferase